MEKVVTFHRQTHWNAITHCGSGTCFSGSAKTIWRRLRQKPVVVTCFLFTPGLTVTSDTHLKSPLTSLFRVPKQSMNRDIFPQARTGVANSTVKAENEEDTLEEAPLEGSNNSTSHRFMAQPCCKTVVRLPAQPMERSNWPTFCQGFEAPPSEIKLNAVIIPLC